MNPARHVHAALDRFARRYLFADAASADAYLQMHRARLLGFGIPLVNAKLFDINLPLSLIDRAPLS